MSLCAINGNNLAYLALAIEENSGFLAIKVDGPALCSTAMKYFVQIVECVNLGQNSRKLFAYARAVVLVSLGQNMCHLGVGHTRMGVHHGFIKLVATNLTLCAYLHLTDHTQAVLRRI